MSLNVIKESDVKYLNKDFQGFKRDLMRFAKVHFSSSFQDFNESSPGMMLIELQSYIGDVLAFYLDQQFNELKIQTAQQIGNVSDIAKMLGYRPQGPRAASVDLALYAEVPAQLSGSSYGPNLTLAPRILPYARFAATNGTTFETNDQVDFSSDDAVSPLLAAVSRRDDNNIPTHFALRKSVIAYAGLSTSETFQIGDFQSFLRLELSNANVIDVISITDSEGNTWYQVDHLSQDTVITPVQNNDADSDIVPYVIRFLTVPRRFVVDRDVSTGKTYLQFGSGDGYSFDDEIVPNVADMSLPVPARGYYNGFVLDPQNFLKTTSLGMSPYNTTLTVTYRYGGGPDTNVDRNTITSVESVSIDFSTPSTVSSSYKNDVISSLECTNLSGSEGGAPAETVAEIKANASAYFAAQGRAVTREDYMSHIMSMPAKFGKPEKVFITKDTKSQMALNIHVLAKNSAGNLALATTNLKNNVKKHLKNLRMLTDAVNIIDSRIINIGISFGVVVGSRFNRVDVLARTLNELKNYFHIDQMQIGQPIVRSDVESVIQNIDGVISVYNLEFTNIFGTVGGQTYSDVRHDMRTLRNGIIYCPQDSIFEVKFPNIDIVGETK